MLDARRLEVLKAVVDAGSITAAAQMLGFTPSAVSQSVSALEREAKTALFEKVGRGIRPTQAGLLLAEHAELVLAQLREAELALASLRAGQAGRLRLAAFATAGGALVPRALAHFRSSHPAVELDFEMAETDEALARLRAGHIELAVIAQDVPAHDVDDRLAYTHLLDDPYRVVLPRTHRLGGRPEVDLADLAEDPWIATASARCNCTATVSTACARAGFAPRFAMEADEFATTVGFVAAELGVAMVPLLALSSIPDNVRVRRIREAEPVRHVYAVTRRQIADQPALQAMHDALLVSAGSYLRVVA
ncbi:MAG: LysR family transcriptional regulator [Actinomycetota bacterium]